MAGSALLIYNPGSGQRRTRFDSVLRMVDALRQRGVSVTTQVTAAPGDATRLAAEAVAAKVDVVLVHGGDGTVNEALQSLAGGETPLAVWPGGTANVLALEVGLPLHPVPAARELPQLVPQRMLSRSEASSGGSSCRRPASR